MNDITDVELIVTAIKEISGRRRLVFINYEPAFAIYSSEIRKYHIQENQPIAMKDYDIIVGDILSKRASIRAISLLQGKDYTEQELCKKLEDTYYPKTAIAYAIEYVKKYGYVDDQRYIENYIVFNAPKKSKMQLSQFLYQKGIPSSLIEEALNHYYEENEDVELQTIVKQMKKKCAQYPEMNFEAKQKIFNYFCRKGFSLELVKKALDIVVGERYNI
jgi:regulatory protein